MLVYNEILSAPNSSRPKRIPENSEGFSGGHVYEMVAGGNSESPGPSFLHRWPLYNLVSWTRLLRCFKRGTFGWGLRASQVSPLRSDMVVANGVYAPFAFCALVVTVVVSVR